MLPSAHTTCSLTSTDSEPTRATSEGTALCETTAWHWSLLPDAMFVRHHAASNCILLIGCCRSITRRGVVPASITSSIGGLFGQDSSLRIRTTASRHCSASSCGPFASQKPMTICDSSGTPSTSPDAASSTTISADTAVMLRLFMLPSSLLALRSCTF
jgi:hypothetical protein